jgi:hypothetical protein
MKNLNEEIKRIQTLLGVNTTIISEQTNVQGVTTTVKFTTTPDSDTINNLFQTEFLPSLIPNREALTITQYIEKLKSITDEQLSKSIEFFKTKGYKQPSDKIKQFQQDLLKVTGIATFTNTKQVTAEFNDGVFGAATGRALINRNIENLKRLPDQNKKVGDVFARAKESVTNPSLAQKTTQQTPSQGNKDLAVNVGTQGIK